MKRNINRILIGFVVACSCTFAVATVANAAGIELSITADPVLGQWQAFAKIPPPPNVFGYRETPVAGEEILGIYTFLIDVLASGDLAINTSVQKAPQASSPNLGFGWFGSDDGTIVGGNVMSISGSQSMFTLSEVLVGAGIAAGTQGGLSWDHPALLAEGTFTGSLGTLTVQEHLTGNTGNRQQDAGFTLLYGDPGVGFVDLSKIEASEWTQPAEVFIPEPSALAIALSGMGSIVFLCLTRHARRKRRLPAF